MVGRICLPDGAWRIGGALATDRFGTPGAKFEEVLANVERKIMPETNDNNEIFEVLDESENDQTVPSARYEITSYGADYDVDGLVKRIKRGDIFVPSFQRDYVWTLSEASRFVESLLLGLPVPGIFLAKEAETNKLLVIDGQQRLKSLQFFYEGYFNPKPEDKTKRVFELAKVLPRFSGKTYATLEEKDRIQLDNSIVHATVIKQESPEGDDTSVYHVFERLNTGGQKLTSQEIRIAAYHGRFCDLITRLNENIHWREIYGKKSNRLKDQELILRYLAMYFQSDRYTKPMNEFLNKFALRNRNPSQNFLDLCEAKFIKTIEVVHRSIGKSAFRPERSLNAAVFDSVMVGITRRLDLGEVSGTQKLSQSYTSLLSHPDYSKVISQSTADESSVKTRLDEATTAFRLT